MLASTPHPASPSSLHASKRHALRSLSHHKKVDPLTQHQLSLEVADGLSLVVGAGAAAISHAVPVLELLDGRAVCWVDSGVAGRGGAARRGPALVEAGVAEVVAPRRLRSLGSRCGPACRVGLGVLACCRDGGDFALVQQSLPEGLAAGGVLSGKGEAEEVQVAGDGLFGHGVSRWLLVGCWLVVGGWWEFVCGGDGMSVVLVLGL
jgi:hypothetical protein